MRPLQLYFLPQGRPAPGSLDDHILKDGSVVEILSRWSDGERLSQGVPLLPPKRRSSTQRRASGARDDHILKDGSVVEALCRWSGREWLSQGVPLLPPKPEISICTDASFKGWGTHILPGFDEARGSWSTYKARYHSNYLERLAVWMARRRWEDRCLASPILIPSDNPTVIAYIQKAGGTKSPQPCTLSYRLLLWCRSR